MKTLVCCFVLLLSFSSFAQSEKICGTLSLSKESWRVLTLSSGSHTESIVLSPKTMHAKILLTYAQEGDSICAIGSWDEKEDISFLVEDIKWSEK